YADGALDRHAGAGRAGGGASARGGYPTRTLGSSLAGAARKGVRGLRRRSGDLRRLPPGDAGGRGGGDKIWDCVDRLQGCGAGPRQGRSIRSQAWRFAFRVIDQNQCRPKSVVLEFDDTLPVGAVGARICAGEARGGSRGELFLAFLRSSHDEPRGRSCRSGGGPQARTSSCLPTSIASGGRGLTPKVSEPALQKNPR